MWPWDEIRDLKEENEGLSRRITYLEGLKLSDADMLELEFLRCAIADYVVYRHELARWALSHRYYATRTLQASESDLAKSRLYIAVLEAQLGPAGVNAAKEVCERLKAVCSQKAIDPVSGEK